MNKRTSRNGVVYYTFDNLEKADGITHCFSTRIGGVSKGYYSSMNLSFTRGDSYDDVLQNFKLICEASGFSYENLVFSDQIHETKVICVGSKDCGKGIIKDSDIKGVDGLMTNQANVVLTTFYADCVPLFFYDVQKKVVALSHAGWKGTVNKIGLKTVEKMKAVYGCNPKDIIAGIGPSIGECCFEVDPPVANEFLDKLEFGDEFVREHKSLANKYNIDLSGINKRILTDAGVLPENIEIAGLCSKCNSDVFYSHRVCGSNRGSLAAFIQLNG